MELSSLLTFYAIAFLLSLFVNMTQAAILLWNRKIISNKFKLLIGKGIGYGKVRIIRPNGTINEVIKKFSTEGFDIDKCKYKFDIKRVYTDVDAIKVVYYREGDTESLDLTQEDIPIIDGKLYATDLVKAMAAGALSVTQPSGFNKKDLLMIVAIGVTMVTAILVFKQQSDITKILKLLIGV